MTYDLIMKPGDLIMFAWRPQRSKISDHFNWETACLGVVLSITAKRPDDQIGNELLVLHEGERFSVPESWCKLIKEGE